MCIQVYFCVKIKLCILKRRKPTIFNGTFSF